MGSEDFSEARFSNYFQVENHFRFGLQRDLHIFDGALNGNCVRTIQAVVNCLNHHLVWGYLGDEWEGRCGLAGLLVKGFAFGGQGRVIVGEANCVFFQLPVEDDVPDCLRQITPCRRGGCVERLARVKLVERTSHDCHVEGQVPLHGWVLDQSSLHGVGEVLSCVVGRRGTECQNIGRWIETQIGRRR